MRWEGGVAETIGSRQESGTHARFMQYAFSSRYDRNSGVYRSSLKLCLAPTTRTIVAIASCS